MTSTTWLVEYVENRIPSTVRVHADSKEDALFRLYQTLPILDWYIYLSRVRRVERARGGDNEHAR